MRKTKTGKDKVVRIDAENYARIRALGEGREKKLSLNQLLGLLLDSAETVITGDIKYAVKLYDDPADARGEAIMQAVRTKQMPEMPLTVVVIGQDHL